MFKTLHIVSFLFGLGAEKIGVFSSENIFQGSHNCHLRVQRSFLRKIIAFPDNFLFLFEFWSCSFFVPCQISYVSESKHQCRCLDENFLKFLLAKNALFSTVWTLSWETCVLREKLGHVFQNCSVRVRARKLPEKSIWTSDFSSILKVDPKELGIYWEEFGGDVETKLYLYRGIFTEYCFWKKVLKI